MRKTFAVVSSEALASVLKSGAAANPSTPRVCPRFTAWHEDVLVSHSRTVPSTQELMRGESVG